MADKWFEIASVKHFWIRRRFAVLRKLANNLIVKARSIAEVGCGNGLLQKQIEDSFKREVSGFDLNEFALSCNNSSISPVYCYDILQRDPTLSQRFDLILLFDVLEHISDEAGFLDALKFHLAPGGSVIINVPAGQWAYSQYDRAAGHVRRYSIDTLRDSVKASNFSVYKWSYWGLPLLPSLILRTLWLSGKRDQSEVIQSGFDSRSVLINSIMNGISQCEFLPQKLIGTSLMAVLQADSK